MTALLYVFQHLSLEDRCRAAVVSKEWHHAAQHPTLWQTLDLRNRQDAAAFLARLRADGAQSAREKLKAHLRHVDLEFAAGVTDAGLLALRGCALETLNLNACQQVTNVALSALLSSSPGLQRLSLYWNLNVGDDALLHVAALCPALRALSLSGCKNVTDAGIRALARECHELTSLDLTRCVQVTDAGFDEVARGCRELQELRLYACSGVTDRALAAAGTLARLRVLDVTGAVLVSDEGARALAGCRELREAVLTWCIQLTDAGTVPLAEACPRLELLSLHGVQGITDRTVEALAGSCADSLHTLDLSGCSGVARRSHEELRAALPRLRCFVVHS